jgi:hypothetical protein
LLNSFSGSRFGTEIEYQRMLFGMTLAIGGGLVALCAMIALMLMGDPERDKPAKTTPGIKWGIGTTY